MTLEERQDLAARVSRHAADECTLMWISRSFWVTA